MLLTISTEHAPATDLGFLLHKHPDRFQSFSLSFGQAHVFYPEATEERCSACLLVDVDPVQMVRGRGRNRNEHFLLGQYVNDRPYVASSFMSVAISQVFGSALAGRCKDRPELVEQDIPLTARLDVLPVRGGPGLVEQLFEPLGYKVQTVPHPLDEQFPDWGKSPYHSVTIQQRGRLADLLAHLYVLIPVFDRQKHYFVSDDELEKLISKAEDWLRDHPEKDFITRRYLKNRASLVRQATARLQEEVEPVADEVDRHDGEETLERPLSLNEQRLGAVAAALKASGATSIIDFGCGEGKLLHVLLAERRFARIVGVDVSIRSLEIAARRLKFDRLLPWQAERIELMHGSLMYRDKRFHGFDAAAIVEVIEHLDPPRLAAFERVVFEYAKPRTIVLTTPNREYNVMWESLRVEQGTDVPRSPGVEVRYRHTDHRFEWTRQEFQDWANGVAERHGYSVRFLPIGVEDSQVGAPTQMGVFECITASGGRQSPVAKGES